MFSCLGVEVVVLICFCVHGFGMFIRLCGCLGCFTCDIALIGSVFIDVFVYCLSARN